MSKECESKLSKEYESKLSKQYESKFRNSWKTHFKIFFFYVTEFKKGIDTLNETPVLEQKQSKPLLYQIFCCYKYKTWIINLLWKPQISMIFFAFGNGGIWRILFVIHRFKKRLNRILYYCNASWRYIQAQIAHIALNFDSVFIILIKSKTDLKIK